MMNFPVSIEPSGDRFTAALLGAPEVCVSGETREAAIAELRRVVSQRVTDGQIVSLDISPSSVTDFIGVFRDDPTLDEICEEAYRQRDAELIR
jgi:predicted RNase H-like HicB family nuclease